MKTKDLKIGNFVTTPRGIEKVVEVHRNHVMFAPLRESPYITYMIDMLKPIELNKEWLIKLGFEPKQYELQKEEGLFIFAYDVELNLIIHWGTGQLDEGLEHINNVHELQNLYVALTGEELTCVGLV